MSLVALVGFVILPQWAVGALEADIGDGRVLTGMYGRRQERSRFKEREGGSLGASEPSPMPDLGARWRIKIVGSGRFLYKQESSVIASVAFFSLFELRSNGDGSHMLGDHAGNWVHASLPSAPGELPRLVLLPPAPPTPPAPQAEGSSAATGNNPPENLQPLWLKEHSNGAYAFLISLDGSAFLCQEHANPLYIATAMAPPPSPPTSSWWPLGKRQTAEPDPLGATNLSSLFQLQRVLGELPVSKPAARPNPSLGHPVCALDMG